MDDIRAVDQRLFVKALLSPVRVVLTLASLALFAILPLDFGLPIAWAIGNGIAVLGAYVAIARADSVSKRWIHRKYKALWEGSAERLKRMDEALKKLRKDQVADLAEMPKTMHQVGDALYFALRRADLIAAEVAASEGASGAKPPTWTADPNDPQSTELYRIADKNIAEYRAHLAAVLAGVQRTEGQAAVYMTTLDSLRVKILGYRLVGKRPEMSSRDFLEAIAEARAQLQSIDKALDELDLGHYPKTIAVVPTPDVNPAESAAKQPPPLPEDVRARLEQDA